MVLLSIVGGLPALVGLSKEGDCLLSILHNDWGFIYLQVP